MAINTSDLVGGGVYRVRFFSGYTNPIASGSTGTLIDITAPEGMLVRLEALATEGSTSDTKNETGITVRVDSVDIISNKTLAQGSSANTGNSFSVSENGSMSYVPGGSTGTSTVGKASVSSVIGSNIKVIKETGTTTNAVYYSYSFGEIK